jgi:hypothetical protein
VRGIKSSKTRAVLVGLHQGGSSRNMSA